MLDFLLPLADVAPAAKSTSDAAIEFITNIYAPFGVNVPRLLMQFVDFALVSFIVYRFAFKPVLVTLDERQKKIAEGLKYTEDMKLKLADAKKQHTEILRRASEEAHQVLVNAETTAKRIVEKATGAAAKQAEAIVKKGEQAIALERQQMLTELRREVAQLVLDTASRVLARDLSNDERTRFASSAAQDLSKN